MVSDRSSLNILFRIHVFWKSSFVSLNSSSFLHWSVKNVGFDDWLHSAVGIQSRASSAAGFNMESERHFLFRRALDVILYFSIWSHLKSQTGDRVLHFIRLHFVSTFLKDMRGEHMTLAGMFMFPMIQCLVEANLCSLWLSYSSLISGYIDYVPVCWRVYCSCTKTGIFFQR